MLNEIEIKELWEALSSSRFILDQSVKELVDLQSAQNELEAALRHYEEARKQFRESEAASGLMDFVIAGDRPMMVRRVQKTNVQIYEEIIRDNEGAMHVSAIAAEAVKRGIKLKGKSSPGRMVRNSLVGSDRFVNIGGNRWLMEGMPVPDAIHKAVASQADWELGSSLKDFPEGRAEDEDHEDSIIKEIVRKVASQPLRFH